MKALIDRVSIGRRFLRSVRIDSDLTDPRALEGFVCPQTSADVLLTMARHVSEAGQGAFTWTGPYGSGKSSLAVALSALLNGNAGRRRQATTIFKGDVAQTVRTALPPGANGWRIVPVVGRRDNPVAVIGEALQAGELVSRRPRGGWREIEVVNVLRQTAARRTDRHGGVILFIDEMGKFLEAAAQEGADLYVFQQLAEAASRSDGRLLIIGILHQAFEEYAHRLSQEVRDEWSKIQGRFVDLAINTAGEEQIDLISRAIESDHAPKKPGEHARLVASMLHRTRASDADSLARMLEGCWPLHPVVACLLGPISRRRFGQNQRSIFGFLNSAEPHGFQDFLRGARPGEFYEPVRLWDYLRANLEPSILASPDGHRWALAAEALERCEAIGGTELHIRLLKTIAVVDLFKERSALVPSLELLKSCFTDTQDQALRVGLGDLEKWSFTIFRKFLDAHAIYAGSDFDIDLAVRGALEAVDQIDFDALKSLAGLQPILAKKHYHETGTLRWFDISIAPACEIAERAGEYEPSNGTMGQFVLAIPTEGENEDFVSQECREAARRSGDWDTVAGVSKRSWAIVALARELLALETVRSTRAELAGDSVARREVSARLAVLQGQLETELHNAFDSASWYRKHHQPKSFRQADLNSLASELADRRFGESPILHNELLNRQKPSGSAIAAQNVLLRRMVLNEGEPRLGIEDFPAEGGLLASVLEATGLYAEGPEGWRFVSPPKDDDGRLAPMWKAATQHIKRNGKRTISVSEIYKIWGAQPYGVKDGLMPVLAVAFIQSQRDCLAVYRDGIFRARFDDVDVEYLAKDPGMIQLRWMDLSTVSRRLLSGMADIVRTLDQGNELAHLEPIDVARGLVGIFEKLPAWTKRTGRLSANAIRVRDLFKRAHDPNQFLFDDIPALVAGRSEALVDEELAGIISGLRDGLEELVRAYPTMLHRLRDMMLAELQVPNCSPQALAELRERADNVRQLGGDFHVEALVGRLSQFEGSDEDFEGIASLAANKPPRDWVDPDLDRASIDLADLSQRFLRSETFARVKGRPEKRHAMAVVVGINGRPAPMLEEFQIADTDRPDVDALIALVEGALDHSDIKRRNVILAALAELTASYMCEAPKPTKKVMGWVHHE
jgi:hypothetical protein